MPKIKYKRVSMNKKKLMGMLYPVFILIFMVSVYYCLIVNLIIFNRANVFANKVSTAITITYLVIFHVLLGIITYCYLFCLLSNPGEPPQFWVT